MTKVGTALLKLLPALVLVIGLCWVNDAAAQGSAGLNQSSTSQQQPSQQQDVPGAKAEPKAFSGKIVKAGDKLVLTDSTGAVTYQLDDQQKAKEFLGKNVKVTGVLDPATGTIRITTIEPAS